MNDPILKSFLERQEKEAMELARDSDILDVQPVGTRPYSRYLISFHCKGLIKTPKGIDGCGHFELGITLPPDYLRHAEAPEILTFLAPPNAFFPNVRFPWICPGRLNPGMSLVDLLFQCYEILSYQRFNPQEEDALNPIACSWARKNAKMLPTDSRPLKRRRLASEVEDEKGESNR